MGSHRQWICLFLLLLPAVLPARTWVVQQDGTGDFTDIQQAVDAAAVGDTVLVGPGRYDTFHVFWPGPEVAWMAVVGVQTDSLTIRGLDRDAVIIGPTEYPFPVSADADKVYRYKGIASGLQVTWMTVENMTFEYCHDGVQMYPAGEVRDCTFRHFMSAAVMGDKSLRLLVEDCLIQDASTGIDVAAYGGGQIEARIQRVRGEGVAPLVTSTGHPNVIIESCTTDPGGICLISGGAANVADCESRGGSHGVSVWPNSIVTLTHCTLHAAEYSSTVMVDNGVVQGSGNVIESTPGNPTIKGVQFVCDLHDSHILHGDNPYTVRVDGYLGHTNTIDLRHNYWGTASGDSIAAWIWDGRDDPSIETYVQYEPFSSVPLPTRQRSWGGVKALFR